MSATLELFDLIGELARQRRLLAERTFAAVGLNHTEARLLTLLGKTDGASPQEALCNQLSVDRTNAGRALDRLAQAGLVERRRDPEDKRARTVHITRAGRRRVDEIAALRKSMADDFLGGLSQQEAAGVVRLLRERLQRPVTAPPEKPRTRTARG